MMGGEVSCGDQDQRELLEGPEANVHDKGVAAAKEAGDASQINRRSPQGRRLLAKGL